MSATSTKGTFGCVCGQSFPNALGLKHHRWVSKHESVDAPPHDAASAPMAVLAPEPEAVQVVAAQPESSEDAYEAAIQMLQARRAQQRVYEQSVPTGPSVLLQFLEFAGEVARAGVRESARLGKQAAVTGKVAAHGLMRLLVVAMVLLSLVAVGAGVGSWVASASGTGLASSPSGVLTVASI